MDITTLKDTALIGHTGFVGSNLMMQTKFEHTYNSKNCEAMADQHFDLLVCAGLSAAKWLANKDPENDKRQIDRLIDVLSTVTADYFVLISTIDVYSNPNHVTEDDIPVTDGHHAYGAHRFAFEQFVRSHFKDVLTLRLPALFGPGLKKNAIFDLINDNNIDQINPDGSFQWYPVDRLWRDVQTAALADLHLLNISTEPVATMTIAQNFFPESRLATKEGIAPIYDMWSIHSEIFGSKGHYILGKEKVLQSLSTFVAANSHACI